MKKNVFFILFCAVFYTFSVAQSAEKLTELMDAESLNLEQGAYFASAYLEIGSDDMSDQDALATLNGYINFPKIKNAKAALSYANFSYFCTRVWGIKGGLMYRMTKSPRYALRELKALGFVKINVEPGSLVKGQDAIQIMNKCAEYADAKNAKGAAK